MKRINVLNVSLMQKSEQWILTNLKNKGSRKYNTLFMIIDLKDVKLQISFDLQSNLIFWNRIETEFENRKIIIN